VYTPEAFNITDENIIEEFIAKNPFAILISEENDKIEIIYFSLKNTHRYHWLYLLLNVFDKLD